jgi:hypothetical protein
MIKYEMPYENDALEKLIYYSNTYKNSNNYIVEIGCSNNSWFLNEPLSKYRGIRIDADLYKILGYGPSQFPIKSINSKVSADNICDTLKENNVPEDFFMLCLDIDGPDYFVLNAILQKYKPKIIITEYNEIIPYPVKFAIKSDNNFVWTGGHIYGYSVACVEDIMNNYNYNLDDLIVNNLFLIRNDENKIINTHEIENFYKKGYLFNKKYPRNDMSLYQNEYNLNLQFLQELKNKDEIAHEFRKYFIDNPINKYNGKSTINNIDNYVINDEYEEYLKKFLNNFKS